MNERIPPSTPNHDDREAAWQRENEERIARLRGMHNLG